MMTLLFWLFYFTGWALHLYSQGAASVKSNSNGLTSVQQWMRMHAHVIAIRLFLAVCSMLLWHESPSLFSEVIGRALPMTKATCGIMGFGIDALWDKVTFLLGLKVEVPQLAPPQP